MYYKYINKYVKSTYYKYFLPVPGLSIPFLYSVIDEQNSDEVRVINFFLYGYIFFVYVLSDKLSPIPGSIYSPGFFRHF